ncbi:MAG: class I SAM-dependent methyltransferase [Longimicrobiales bacterium]
MTDETSSGTATNDDVPATTREFAAWNETMVERYDIERYYERSHALVRWVERRRLQALVDLAHASPDARVLEVGCGAGHVLERFADHERVGVDLSSTMLARTRRRLRGRAGLINATAAALPFADGAFDIVLCTEVLEHVPDPARVVTELVRVAGPAGRVIVSIPNEANIDRAKKVLRRLLPFRGVLRTLASEGNEWHIHRLDLTALRRMVRGVARIEGLRAVPNALLPLRYVASLRANRS